MMQFMGLQRVRHDLVTKNNNKTELMNACMLSHFSHVRLFATPRTVARQAPLSMDSPGKNTAVGCRFLLRCMKVKSESEVA